MANPAARADADDGHKAERAAPPPPATAAPAEPAAEIVDDDRLLRAMADLDNLRKRFVREVSREREAERLRVAAEWLPVVDDLDRALEHATSDLSTPTGILEGIQAVRDHAVAVLHRLGFARFEDIGMPFDPARHEAAGAVDAAAAEAVPGTVVAAVRPGYGTPEVVLRPASVIVARA
jgi:molecular chaperone GrpE